MRKGDLKILMGGWKICNNCKNCNLYEAYDRGRDTTVRDCRNQKPTLGDRIATFTVVTTIPKKGSCECCRVPQGGCSNYNPITPHDEYVSMWE